MNRVGPGFFETIGLPIVAGRGLGVQDHAAAPRVAVVNETAARAFFGDSEPARTAGAAWGRASERRSRSSASRATANTTP